MVNPERSGHANTSMGKPQNFLMQNGHNMIPRVGVINVANQVTSPVTALRTTLSALEVVARREYQLVPCSSQLNMMAFGSFTNELSVVLGSDYLSESETITDSPIIGDEPPSIPPYHSAEEDGSLLLRTNSDPLEFFEDGVGDGMPALEPVSDSESDDDDDVLD